MGAQNWLDIRAPDFGGLDPECTIAVLPTAAIEQHGPHMPVGTDTLIAEGMLDQLRAALPVDAVLLGLHGAMIADGCVDCEGELIRLAREIAGPQAKIGVTFDPHSHLSDQRVRHADVITVFKEFRF